MKETLGDFQILREIGKGPLGSVYLGEHRFIKKKYAIKVLPSELVHDPEFVKRFEKEIGKIATLEHTNLAKVHNVSSDQGNYFIVSDFISDGYGESKNLSQYLGTLNERLAEKEVVSILQQVASAIDYIHSKTFEGKVALHGSLKLNNIVIGKQVDSTPHVYLTDGGLSHIIGQGRILTKTYMATAEGLSINPRVTGLEGDKIYASQEVDNHKLTKLHRSFLQNYAFLAPEQKHGIGNYKSDIYAFGILAYFLLMGYLPEGVFTYPMKAGTFVYNWDLLIDVCLRQKADERPDGLVALMETIVQKELKEIERTIVKVSQEVAQDAVQKPTIATGLYDLEEQVVKVGVGVVQKKQPVINPSELRRLEFEEDPGAIFQAATAVTPYKKVEKPTEEIEPILSEMVVISAGEYWRGSTTGARDEKPRHKVVVGSFALDVHPVTNEQYIRFLEVMGGEKDSNNNDMILLKESRIKKVGGKLTIETGYTKHPVVGVSWYGAVAYAKWVGKRLPTEAEWEVAASCASEDNVYTYGQKIERTQANFFSADTTAVMSYPPNAWGFYDIAGNVYEWCEDWYSYNYYEISQQEPHNPKGPPQGVYRVLRGGCWKSLSDDLRCSHRHRNNPGMMNRTCGFRLAADVA